MDVQLPTGITMGKPKPPLSERIHSVLVRGWGLPGSDFSEEYVHRAMAALNAARGPRPALGAEVLWLAEPNAFTFPGRYVYISRRFLERCASEDPAAFALAHEIGHHDLGHLNRVERWMFDATAFSPGRLALLLIEAMARWVYSREQELAADAYALDLCLKAGFDVQKCLKAFDILAEYMLDHHDTDGVYGLEEDLDVAPSEVENPVGRVYLESRLWWARHRRSHPAITERRDALEARSAQLKEASRSG